MAGREVVSEDRVEQDEAEIGESEEERTFVVGVSGILGRVFREGI